MSENLVSRGVRGAITIESNSEVEIEAATVELLGVLLEKNKIDAKDISHVIFSLTKDIDAAFPAKFARKNLGWDYVPMICTNELGVPESLKKCIRVLMVVNTSLSQEAIHHAYLKGAAKLRPDLVD